MGNTLHPHLYVELIELGDLDNVQTCRCLFGALVYYTNIVADYILHQVLQAYRTTRCLTDFAFDFASIVDIAYSTKSSSCLTVSTSVPLDRMQDTGLYTCASWIFVGRNTSANFVTFHYKH